MLVLNFEASLCTVNFEGMIFKTISEGMPRWSIVLNPKQGILMSFFCGEYVPDQLADPK